MSPPRLSLALLLMLAWLAGCAPPPPAAVSATGSVQLAVHLPDALSGEVSRVTVTVSGDDMPSRSIPLVLTDGIWGGGLSDLPVGPPCTFLAQAFDASGTPRHEGRAEGVTLTPDSQGLVSLTLQNVTTRPPLINAAPIIDSLVATPTTVLPGGQVSLKASAHDPDPGDSVSYAWSATTGRFSAPGRATTTWTAPTTQGAAVLSLTVSDSRGASVTQSVKVNVSTGSGSSEVNVGFNTAPQLLSLTSSQSILDVGQQTLLALSATDADGDPLGYQWSATCTGSFTGQGTSSATFTPSALPSAACNNCQLNVVVKDGRGGQNTGSLSLCVARDTRHAPPSIVRGYQSSLTATAGQLLTFEVEASDPAGSALSFSWAASTGTLGPPSTGATTSRTSWTAPDCGSPNLTATITNAFALSATKSFTVTGLPACLAPGASTPPGSPD